jgi:hypothetical protein
MLEAVREGAYAEGQREPLLGDVEIPRGITRSAGSLWTRKSRAVSQAMWDSRERAVNLMAWVGVRTTIERLCTGEARWELEGEIINGVSSLTSMTPVTIPTR